MACDNFNSTSISQAFRCRCCQVIFLRRIRTQMLGLGPHVFLRFTVTCLCAMRWPEYESQGLRICQLTCVERIHPTVIELGRLSRLINLFNQLKTWEGVCTRHDVHELNYSTQKRFFATKGKYVWVQVGAYITEAILCHICSCCSGGELLHSTLYNVYTILLAGHQAVCPCYQLGATPSPPMQNMHTLWYLHTFWYT